MLCERVGRFVVVAALPTMSQINQIGRADVAVGKNGIPKILDKYPGVNVGLRDYMHHVSSLGVLRGVSPSTPCRSFLREVVLIVPRAARGGERWSGATEARAGSGRSGAACLATCLGHENNLTR